VQVASLRAFWFSVSGSTAHAEPLHIRFHLVAKALDSAIQPLLMSLAACRKMGFMNSLNDVPAGVQSISQNPKTELNQLCQRTCQRPVTKSDVEYVTSKFGQQFGNQFQSVVKLNCFQGQQYAGDPAPNPKEAERSAAQHALSAHASQLPPSAPKTKERTGGIDEADNPAITPKTKLNSLCMQIVKRYLQKGETAYESRKVPGGYQATVQLSALPGDWKDRLWTGQVFTTKQKAEQSAAEMALKQISEDEELKEEASRPKSKGSSSAKGGWVWQDEQQQGSGHNMPREQVLPDLIAGEVKDWKDSYGWIMPTTVIQHPAANLRKGRVYVHESDLADGMTSLATGSAVRFHVYADPMGLGAQNVCLA